MGKSVDDDLALERELPVKLVVSELLERGEAMAECELQIDKHKAQRKAVNALISKQVDERAKLAHTIESGVETRMVLCKWIGDYAKNVWNLVRQDTGEHVDSRPMTAADRQSGLPFEEVTIDDQSTAYADPPAAPRTRSKKRRSSAAKKPAKKTSTRARKHA